MKIYSVKYTAATTLPKARAPIVIPGGKMMCVKVPLVSEGSITRLIIKQTAGSAAVCKVRVLDSVVPYSEGVHNAGTSAADDVELYEIIAQQTTSSGSAFELIHEEYGFPFHNQDGASFTDNQRYIYIILEPQSAGGSTTWAMAITCRTEVG